jgi:hypothetical protein
MILNKFIMTVLRLFESDDYINHLSENGINGFILLPHYCPKVKKNISYHLMSVIDPKLSVHYLIVRLIRIYITVKCKVIPLQARCGPEGG